LRREQPGQPLHNQVAVLWASSKLPNLLPDATRKSIVDAVMSKQEADGGWTISSLGKFAPHPTAPPAPAGSNAYATAFVTFALQEAGVTRSDAKLRKALDWLKGHQNPETGVWTAMSMNKVFEADSMQIRFMQDAATAFATLALLKAQ